MVPTTASKLIALLNNPDADRDEIVQTLRVDNVLTAKLLRVCNSAHTGLKNPVGSIDQAVLILGDSAIYRMVCALGFGPAMGYEQPGQSIEANGLWSHSLSVGLGAEHLTKSNTFNQFAPSMSFTAGLLHDIGKLVLNQVLTPKTRAEIREKISAESLSRVGAEKAVLGVDHAEVGACLLQSWSLPEILVEGVAHHPAPVARPVAQLSSVVYLANCAFHTPATGPGWEADAQRASQEAAAKLGLEEENAGRLIAGAQGAMKAVNEFLRVS